MDRKGCRNISAALLSSCCYCFVFMVPISNTSIPLHFFRHLNSQRFPDIGSADRDFQECGFFAGAYGDKIKALPTKTQLRLYALHAVAGGATAAKDVSRLHIVERAKFRALKQLLSEEKTMAEVRAGFVDIIQANFPNWKELLNDLSTMKITKRRADAILNSFETGGSGNTLESLESFDSDTSGVDSVHSSFSEAAITSDAVSTANSASTRSKSLSPKKDNKEDLKSMWVPDKFARKCQRCKTRKFNLVHRRHHCRRCGLVVCGSCSRNKVELPENYEQVGLHRVCSNCFDASIYESKKMHFRRQSVVNCEISKANISKLKKSTD